MGSIVAIFITCGRLLLNTAARSSQVVLTCFLTCSRVTYEIFKNGFVVLSGSVRWNYVYEGAPSEFTYVGFESARDILYLCLRKLKFHVFFEFLVDSRNNLRLSFLLRLMLPFYWLRSKVAMILC